MAESGWLIRSLVQVPYDSKYSGAIRPDSIKDRIFKPLTLSKKEKT